LPDTVKSLNEIPFLPIEFFKNQQVLACLPGEVEKVFTSSGTGGSISTHALKSLPWYINSFTKSFELFYGKPENYCILALLPGYLEREGSSLVYMCNQLIQQSKHPNSGFYLNNVDELKTVCEQLKERKTHVLLVGVSYALLDFAESGVRLNDNFIVMETGGMKGTRPELLKEELHKRLEDGFQIKGIQSEYGMTEMLSQAYARENGEFESPPWLKFLIRDTNDPMAYASINKTGGVNVIDLANLYSCSFIATQDLGKITIDGKLILMGRFDQSDVRGCNLMLQ